MMMFHKVTVTGDNKDRVDDPGDERSVTITNTPSGGGFTTAKSVEVTVYDNDDGRPDIHCYRCRPEIH